MRKFFGVRDRVYWLVAFLMCGASICTWLFEEFHFYSLLGFVFLAAVNYWFSYSRGVLKNV